MTTPHNFDVREIMRIIPHRYPFLLVDKIEHVDLATGIVKAIKNVTMNEAFFQGHFPETPIMPGVLILEALAQTGGVLVHLKAEKNKIALLLKISTAKFRRPVRPGDVLKLDCTLLHMSSKGGRVNAVATVDGATCCEAEIWFALVDKENL